MKQSLDTFSVNLKRLSAIIFAAFFVLINSAAAQDSKGNEFWICFPGNNSSVATQLYITAEQASTVTITIPGLGFSQVVNVAAGGLQVVAIPATAQVQTQFVADNKGIHIVATTEVTVYGMNALTATTDAFLAFPLDAIGKEYYCLGYYRDFSFSIPTQATIVATQNNTTVTITTTVTGGGFTAGTPQNIVLQQGQVYQLRSLNTNADYSGTKVVADKPVSVFGGAQCTNISGNLRACDHLVEQLPPLSSWGKRFLTVPLATRTAGDVFRFLAQKNATEVRVNGVLVTTLNAGQFFETILGSATYNRITSTEPILVGQYSRSSQADNVTSDPFFALVPPDEQFLNSYIVSAGTSNIPINFINITSPTANIGTVKVDGTVVTPGLWNAITGTLFSGAKVPVSVGVHKVSSSLPIGALVYGFGSFDSYGYLGGQSFSPVATVNTLTITPKTGTKQVGTEQCFDALVKDQFNSPVVGVKVDFDITGANPGSTGFAITNANGIAHFCYTGTNAGTDNIVAAVGSVSDAASFIWTKVAVTNEYYSKASGDLHNVLSWGVNLDGSGATPPDFGVGKTFHLVNRVPNYTMTANWTVGGKLDIPSGSQLRINGFTLSIADLIGTGSLSGTLTSNLVVAGSTGDVGPLNFVSGGGLLNNFTLNRTGTAASASVATPLSIYGVLTITNGALNTGNNITLKSSATNTARVAPIAGSVSGNVTVERYIPARRAWRIMSAPVGGTQKINGAWQEGATTSSVNPNPNPGFGTHITEGSAANGFDHNPLVALVSIKKYISASDSWTPLTNTNATNVNSDAYLLFVRGHRATPLGYNTVTPTNTTLRATGPLKTGDQTFPVSATGFTAIPNPFASPINYATITRNNVPNNFYLWDPKLGGTSGVGGYVLVSFNGTSYDITPAPVSAESQFIQSGQGFLVRSTGGAGSVVIKESDKSATAATDVFRSANTTKGLRFSLQIAEEDNTTSMLDEAFTSYNTTYSNRVDDMDPVKLPNINENLGIARDGQSLMMERRQEFTGNDTINLQLWNTTQRNYLLQFNPVNLSTSTILSGYLEDKYLHTSTPLSLSEVTKVYFTVDANAASSNKDRFRIVLSSKKTQPVYIASLTSDIKLSTNPIIGNSFGIQFINQPISTFSITLFNNLGQKIYQGRVIHGGGTAIQTLQFPTRMVKGLYRMHVTNGKEKSTYSMPVIIN